MKAFEYYVSCDTVCHAAMAPVIEILESDNSNEAAGLNVLVVLLFVCVVM